MFSLYCLTTLNNMGLHYACGLFYLLDQLFIIRKLHLSDDPFMILLCTDILCIPTYFTFCISIKKQQRKNRSKYKKGE